MEEADWIVDFGPGAGEHGGEIVAEGTPAPGDARPGLAHRRVPLRARARSPSPGGAARRGRGAITVAGARENNLKDVTVAFPLGTLRRGHRRVRRRQVHAGERRPLPGADAAALRHARGPGQARAPSTAIEHVDKVIDIDQQPIGRTPRSNPATYTKVFDFIREVFAQTPEARAFGYQPGRFSFNVKGGRCEACQGDGMKLVEMHFLADVLVPCEVCQGKRFNDATLRVQFKGKNIAEVLDLSVREAMEHFSAPPGDRPHPEDARRRRPRLHQARPALPHPLRRRGAAHQALARAGAGRHGPHPLHPRRAHHRPALRRREEAARRARSPGGRRQHRGGHRAQPRRDQVRRLGHRPRPRGRRRRGAGSSPRARPRTSPG